MRTLRILLLSDTTFGAGSTNATEVDVEIELDDGVPVVSVKRIAALLKEQWLAMAQVFPGDALLAREVLGEGGDLVPGGAALLHLDTAQLGDGLLAWVLYARQRTDFKIPSDRLLRAMTTKRAQTARDRTTYGPAAATLRSSRALIRGISFEAPLSMPGANPDHWRLLARLCLAVRHAGSGRNRGRGHVQLDLIENDIEVTMALADLPITAVA